MRRFLFASAVLTTVALTLSGADDKKADDKKVENLLVNGSFEDGPDAGAFVSLDEKDTQIKYDPAKSVTEIKFGEEIALSEKSFAKLAYAFFEDIATRYP